MSESAEIQKLKEEFQFTLSKVSHEIRNPVTLIHSYLQMTENKYPQVTEFDYWDDIRENMDYLIELLNELSVYNNAGHLKKVRLNLDHFLRAVVSSVRPAMRYLNIQVNYTAPSTELYADIDDIKLRQALLNIIRNASEAIDTSGRIQIELHKSDACAQISITDNGSGIPEEYIPTLFDPFVTHKKDGTGLGLAITRQVIQAHNGRIEVTSQEHVGTTFTLSLPLSVIE